MSCTDVLFSFDNELYVNKDGMCMGSNLGPTMAGYAMNMVEKQFPNIPLFYKRYVDDSFAIFSKKEEAHHFLSLINKIHRNIQFTIEEEKADSLVFLDICVERFQNKMLTKWHIKGTNTGTYLNKQAFSPKSHKSAAIRSLINRAYKLCSKYEDFEKCFKLIRCIFINNGYN